MHFLLELCELCPEIHLQLEALGKHWGERTTNIAGPILFLDVYGRLQAPKELDVIRWSMTTFLGACVGRFFLAVAQSEAWMQITSVRGCLLSGATAKKIWNGRSDPVQWRLA